MKNLWLFGLILFIVGGIASCQQSSQSTPIVSYPPPATPTALLPASASPSGDTLRPPSMFPGKLAFHSKRSGVLQIYVLHGDTGEINSLTSGSRQSFDPNWSPDCQSLVYASGNGGDDDFEIYVMQADGQNAHKLFNHPTVDDWSPTWSPQGDVVAYANNAGGKLNICFVTSEGNQKGCLPRGDYDNAHPATTPDGSKIVFASNRDRHWNLYLAAVGEESEPLQLTKNTYKNIQPSFSPDGRLITFASRRMENYDIFVINADGSHERQLTTNPADDVTPRWVGDNQIAFASLRSGNWELFLMKSDGKGIRQLTHAKKMDKWPEWCPTD